MSGTTGVEESLAERSEMRTEAQGDRSIPPRVPRSAVGAGFRGAPHFHFWLVALFLTLVSMGLQWRGLSAEAVIDDHGWMHEIAQRGCGTDVGDCFKHPQLRYYYRPLVAVSFALGERWYQPAIGNKPASFLSKYWLPLWPQNAHPDEALPYHIENLLMHGLVVLLIFWMFRLLFRRDLPALLGGLLFALHPLSVPVTTFIGGRTDNMALIFVALFVIGLLKMQGTNGENQKEENQKERGVQPVGLFPTLTYSALLWLLLSVLAFAGALFTKEQCVLLVALAPLLVTLARPRPWGRWLGWQSIYALPIAAYVWCAHQVALTVQNEDLVHHDGQRSFFSFSLWSIPLHIEMVGRTCWYYFCSFVFPTVSRMHQSTLGPWDDKALGPLGHNAPNVPLPPSPLLAVGGYLALFFALWLLRRTWRDQAARFCLLWLFLTLLPCLNIIPVPSQFIAPYRALIPLVGICGLVGAFFAMLIDPLMIHRLGSQRPERHTSFQAVQFGTWLPITLLVIICAGFVRVTLEDVPQWQNDGVLMQAEMAADPNFVPAKFGEAYLFTQKGETVEAIASYDAGLRQMLPEAKTIDDCIRAGLAPDSKYRVASATSLRYLDIPYLASIFRVRGDLKKELGRWNDAAEDYRVVIALCPKDRIIGNLLAYALDRAGRWQEEETVLKSQIALRADSYRLSQLGSLYFRQRRWELARDTLALALHSPPTTTDAVADLYTAQQQFNEAFVRALPHKSTVDTKGWQESGGSDLPTAK